MNDQTASLATFDLTICICTRNRPDDLATALDSVRASGIPVRQVIVSDDSTDARTRELVSQRFSDIDFVDGPRLGLCANRNAALRHVREPYVLFIDDDAVLGVDFVAKTADAFMHLSPDERERHIVSGVERQKGQLIFPKDQNFFGYQQRAYGNSQRLNTVVINACVFPTSLFERIGFDANLIYGCDEVDLTTRAVGLGYTIVLCPDAVNDHFPSPVNRQYYQQHLNASRLYVTLKRYARTRRDYGRAAVFAILAPLHLAASLVRRSGLRGLRDSVSSLRETLDYIYKYYRRRPDTAARAASAEKHRVIK